MEHNKLLDNILLALVSDENGLLDEQLNGNKMTFSWIVRHNDPTAPQKQIEFLKQKLIDLDIIEITDSKEPEFVKLTKKGRIISLCNWFQNKAADEELNLKLKKQTLESLKFPKWAFFISLASFIISIVALSWTIYIEKEKKSKQEINLKLK